MAAESAMSAGRDLCLTRSLNGLISSVARRTFEPDAQKQLKLATLISRLNLPDTTSPFAQGVRGHLLASYH